MINNNVDVRKAASELYERLIVTGELDVKQAKAAASLLSVIQKSFMIDLMKSKMCIDFLESEEKTDTRGGFIKKIPRQSARVI